MSARALFSPGCGNAAESCRAAWRRLALLALAGLAGFAPSARAGWGAPGSTGAPGYGSGVAVSSGPAQVGPAVGVAAPNAGRAAGVATVVRSTPGAAAPRFANPGGQGFGRTVVPGVFPRAQATATFPTTAAFNRPAFAPALPPRTGPVRDRFGSVNRTPLSRPNPVATGAYPVASAGQRLPSSRPAREPGRRPGGRGGVFGGGIPSGFYPGPSYVLAGNSYDGACAVGNFASPSAYANFSSAFCAPGYGSYAALPAFYGGFYGGAYPVSALPLEAEAAGMAAGEMTEASEPRAEDPDTEAGRSRNRPEATARRPASTLGRGVENPESVRPALRGPDSVVEAVQEELARRGYFAGKADGALGAASQEALRRYQKDQRLAPTGGVNEATLFALGLN